MAKAVSDENLAEFKAYADEEYGREIIAHIPEGAIKTYPNGGIGFVNQEAQDAVYRQIFGHDMPDTPEEAYNDILALGATRVITAPFEYVRVIEGQTQRCVQGVMTLSTWASIEGDGVEMHFIAYDTTLTLFLI